MQHFISMALFHKDWFALFKTTFFHSLCFFFISIIMIGSAVGASFCPPLPEPSGAVVNVASESAIRDQAYHAAANTTIMIASGVYHIQGFVQIINNGVALRGASGNRDDVILDFGGMSGGYFGVQIEGDDVTIADLTIRNANDHGVAIQARDRPVLYNLHIIDIGDQLVKVNPPQDGSNGSDDGLLACSLLEYTTSAPDDYTNGISAHQAHNWVVRDNQWRRIRCIGDQCGPTILFWSQSGGTLVERNVLLDCFRGIAFGNASHGGVDHSGGVVRNNFIYSELSHDVAIEMVHAQDWLVTHNSVLLLNPASGVDWSMEARYSESQGNFSYNLANMRLWSDRDGASASTTGNVIDALETWFVDNAANGNLHLDGGAAAAINQGAPMTEVENDIDGDSRDSSPDIGADEYAGAAPTPTPSPSPTPSPTPTPSPSPTPSPTPTSTPTPTPTPTPVLGFCPPLPAPTGAVVNVASESEIRNQAYNAAANTTIMIASGVYQMQGFIQIIHNGVALRGATGNRGDVILDFGGMANGYSGVLIEGDDVVIADLTIRNASDYGVAVEGRDRPVLYNLHILDSGDQLVEVNSPSDGSNGSDNGLLACSRLEYTTTALDSNTIGVSAHQAHAWVVRDNQWVRVRGNADECGPTILFWTQSTDTIVERNRLINCYRGVAFGNPYESGVNHTGGVIRNNFIYSQLPHDTAIEMVHAQDWLVAHNSVMLFNPANGLDWGMEARYSDSQGLFAYNLTNMRIWENRDDASAALTGNITNAQVDWFVDAAAEGELHLAASAVSAIDQASPLSDVSVDIDGHARGSAPDIGADEFCDIILGDLDNNCLIDLRDAILALQVTVQVPVNVNINADVNTDAKIDLAEALYVLEKIAGLR